MDRDLSGCEEDFYAWTRRQADALRRAGASHLNADVDWEHVAEEIEDLGRSERSAVESHAETVIEHLLKLAFSRAGTERRDDWRVSVAKARLALDRKLTGTLRRHLAETFDRRYRSGRKLAALGLERDGTRLDDLPESCPWTLEQLLDEDFWAEDRGMPA